MRNFLHYKHKKLWYAVSLCVISICFAGCGKKPNGSGASPTPDAGQAITKEPSITVTNTPTPTQSPQPTENPSAALREAAAWEEGDLIAKELLFDQCNAAWDDFLPIMDDGDSYIVDANAAVAMPCLYRCDKQTGEMKYFCNVSDCKHEGEDTCLSTNRKYWYNKIVAYDEHLYVVASGIASDFAYDSDGTSLKLLSMSMDGTTLTEVTTIYELTSTDECLCAEMIIHNGYVITILKQGGTGNTYRVCTTDLRSGKSEMIWEITYPTHSVNATPPYTRYLNAYHNVLFFMADVDGKNALFRYDLKNGRMIDSKRLATDRPYMVLDEDKVLYVSNGVLKSHDFVTDITEKVELSLPTPSQGSSGFGAAAGSVYCYKDYVIVSELKYLSYTSEDIPEVIDYYVFTKDLKDRVGMFQVPIRKVKSDYSGFESLGIPVPEKGWVEHKELLFLKDDIVYSQDRLSGVVIAARFDELLKGKETWMEVYNNRWSYGAK